MGLLPGSSHTVRVRSRKRSQRRAPALIGAGLLHAAVNEPALALSYFFLVPITFAAFAYGRRGAALVAAASLGLFLIDESLFPSEELAGASLVVGASSRALAFFGVGLLVAELLARQRQLTRTVADQERALEEFEALREALTPAAVPELPGLQVATATRPAEDQVGGDFFLAVPGPDGGATVAIGDVVGHGLGAARRAAFVRTLMTALADELEDPAELLRLANVALLRRDEGSAEFVTATCVHVLARERRIVWSSAGHPPPWDLESGTSLGEGHHALPLGVDHNLGARSVEARLPDGGGVLLFTDGLTEARAARAEDRGELLGEEAVRAELRRRRGATPREVVEGLTEVVDRSVDGALADDLTLLALRLVPLSPGEAERSRHHDLARRQ